MTEEERALRELQARILLEAENAAREAARQRRQAFPTDYVFDKQQEQFWDLLDGTLHSEKGVDASIPQERWRVVVEDEGDAPPAEGEARRRGRPRQRRERLVPPSTDIKRVENDQFVEGSTWWPGMDRIIHDQLVTEDGIRPSEGRRLFNKYRAPKFDVVDHAAAAPWIAHVKKLWPKPKEHDHFFDYCAHMVQRPQEKCNSAVVLSGAQGIGKDAALDPVRRAIGAWNSKNIKPDQLFNQFNAYLQTLMLVVDEVRALATEHGSVELYQILKTLIATPPEVMAINQKFVNTWYMLNLLRVILTTNEPDAMFIPEDDRRYFMMHSDLPAQWHIAEGQPDYFDRFFHWLNKENGAAAVYAFLMARDISKFDPKYAPPDTEQKRVSKASWNSASEDEFERALDANHRPDYVFGFALRAAASFESRNAMDILLRSTTKLKHRASKSGYRIHYPDNKSGYYEVKLGDRRYRAVFVLVANRVKPNDVNGADIEAAMLAAAGAWPTAGVVVGVKKPLKEAANDAPIGDAARALSAKPTEPPLRN